LSFALDPVETHRDRCGMRDQALRERERDDTRADGQQPVPGQTLHCDLPHEVG
jgi:hypothetical protein